MSFSYSSSLCDTFDYSSVQVTEGSLKSCQWMEMNVFCLCTWLDLSCFSPSYIIARASGLSLCRAGVLYLEPDLYTNTLTTGEGKMSISFPCCNCQQYNHLPTLQRAFKDSIQKVWGGEMSWKQAVVSKVHVNGETEMDWYKILGIQFKVIR